MSRNLNTTEADAAEKRFAVWFSEKYKFCISRCNFTHN